MAEDIARTLRDMFPENVVSEVMEWAPENLDEAVETALRITNRSKPISDPPTQPFRRKELLPNDREIGDDLEFPKCSPEDIARIRDMIASDRGSIAAIMDMLGKYSSKLYDLIKENRMTLAALFGFDPRLIEQAK